MSIIISPVITDVGLGVFTPSATGIEFTFTHVSVGTGTSIATSAVTALENEIARFPIAGGGIVTGGQAVSINALITNHLNANPQNYVITEIGFHGLNATGDTILFAIHRQSTAIIAKVSGADIACPFVFGLAALPAENMTVMIDADASAMLALLGQHVAANHPHTQYKRTLDNTERLKIADGVAADDAVSKGQLEAEATTRAGVDSALAGQIAQEVLDRQAGDTSEATARENGDLALAIALAAEITNRENAVAQVNFAVFDNEATYNTIGTHTFTVPANVNRVIVELQAPGGGGGQGGGNDGGAEIGGGGGAGASGQWLSVLIFNLMAGDEIVIIIGAKGLGGHSGSTPATAGGDVSFSVTGRANSLTVAKGGRAGAKGLPGDNNGSNPSYRGQGGALWGTSSVKMRFCTRVADVYEESGIGGIQTIHGGKGGDSLFGEGGEGGLGYSGLAAQAGEDGILGSGGGGGGGQGGTGGGVGGDGGEGFAKVYW